MASRFILPFADVGNGISPSDGALLEFFITGTAVQKATFSDEALTTPNTNPVVADGDGVFSDIWIADGSRYKVTLDDKNIVQKFVADPVVGGASAGLSEKSYDTVALMVASKEFNTGDIVNTASHTTVGNGGGNQYEVVASGTGADDDFSFIDLPNTTPPLQAKALFPNGMNVKQAGAVGDGATDDSAAIQVALNFVKTGGVLTFPPGDYAILTTVSPQYIGETPLQRAILLTAGSPTAGPIEDITIEAYGARFVTTTAGFTATFPFCTLGFIGVDRITIKGLQFESDLNSQATGWFDSSNYFNQAPPTPGGIAALYVVNYRDLKIQDCIFEHLAVGVVITDDRNTLIPAAEPMDSYRSIVTGCKFFNIAQGLSITTGATEELIIESNHFDYVFIKMVQESDQGRAIQFKNNTCRDVSGILMSTNNTQITGNTFNNLLGGISLDPQGGTDPSTNYNYDLLGMMIADNQCYSDHATTVLSGTALPQGFLIFNANAANTAGQTVDVDGLVVRGNQIDLWPVGGTAIGSFVNRAGDANIVFKSCDFTENQVTLNNATAAIMTLAALGLSTTTQIDGPINIIGNTFVRTAGNANFEFQFFSKTFVSPSTLTFSDNYVETQGSNRQLSVGNIGKLDSTNNKFVLASVVSSAVALYYTATVPLVNIRDNDILHNSPVGNTGFILDFDAFVTTVYDTVLDDSVVRVTDNTLTNGAAVFSSTLTFPASAEGFFELTGNTIFDNITAAGQPYGTITGFTTENVVNPTAAIPPAGHRTTPSYYVAWSTNTTSAQPTGWIYDGAWKPLGTHA